MPDEKTLSVTRLVRRMKNLLEIELGEVWVEGEISNLRRQASGHMYFTLKDEGAQMSCVMFKGNARYAKVQPEDGMQVKLFGEVSVYEARGSVQLIVRKLEKAGEGELQAKFEALKRKLNAEGLFEQGRKKPLPVFPTKVGLITSGTGAALQDMLNVLGRRAPWVKPILFPVQVQGKGAEHGIADAIRQWSDWQANQLPEVDVLIVGRGGGSLEDLWNFNEEVVARAIADCCIPVVSAVGHEIDFTIADFVADMRAPTPSAAAELVVPDGDELRAKLRHHRQLMERTVERELSRYELILQGMKRGPLSLSAERVLREPMQRLMQLGDDLEDAARSRLQDLQTQIREWSLRHAALKPSIVIEQKQERVTRLKARLQQALDVQLSTKQQDLKQVASLLRTLGPESTFKRGFTVTMKEDGQIVTDAKQLEKGEKMRTRFADGEVVSEVQSDQ